MSSERSDAFRLRIVCGALFLGTLLLFSRAIGGGFLDFDDPDFLTQNLQVQSGLHLQSVYDAFTTCDAGNWAPITRLSHVIAWQLFGANPKGHHAINVILHALNAVLAFLTLRQLTRTFWASAFFAALFAWHPLRVESVAWISERKDVLSAFFALLTFWAYAVYSEKRRANHSGAWRWYGLALAVFVAGLLCKPMLVTLPFILLLLDAWPLNRINSSTTASSVYQSCLVFFSSKKALLFEKAPFLILSAGACYITYVMQESGGAFSANFPIETRLANAAISLIRYLGKFLWPFDLIVPCPYPAHWPTVLAIGSFGILLIITVFSTWHFRSRPWLLVGWLWFLGMLIPVIGLIQVGLQSMADRYTYLPILGIQLILLGFLREYLRPRISPVFVGFTALLILSVCAARTWNQIGFWSNSRTLFEHTLAVSENNYLAHSYLGTSLANTGQLDTAISHYQRALELEPNYAAAHYGLAVALDKKSPLDEAMPHYQKAATLNPKSANFHYGFGLALLKRGMAPEAQIQFQAAAKTDPTFVSAHRGLGLIAARTGKLQEAIQHYEKALSLDPRSSQLHRDLARSLAQTNQHTEACIQFNAALMTNPNDATLHYELGLSLQAMERADEAAAAYTTATRLDPSFAEAHYNLGVILLSQNQIPAAIVHFKSAATSRPDFGPAYFGLGVAAAQSNQLSDAIIYYQKALTFSPDNAELHDALGQALSLVGRPDEARQHQEEAIRLDNSIEGPAKR